ncbi:hypothetical protein GCM10011613_21920 [Cellvibrio zantedeschiae]|uniref:DUF5610 domain-containing protein n=1 Tax=Cellvibrio zantedeschiae TaxID=1237077 RepID=A0ABQ3B6Z0_9GAMM|nr:DUF5610 domain-containing protein [Cellvibrio zantedeschiae]GGY77025.1 hypothetical protein GCM10011613_21920 [Cellvibrio zantedeschiae]
MTLSSINSGAFPSSSLLSRQDQARAQSKSSVIKEAPPIEEKRQSALKLVTRTLSQAYEKIAGKDAVATTAYSDQEPMTATKAAGTILGFIERRLAMDVAEGATQEQLQSRLEAGLEGFKKGFAEAEEKLKALSMFYPEVEADLKDTYSQVLSGIDALKEKLVSGVKTDASVPKESLPNVATPASINNIAIQQGLYEYAEARDFKFELITKEGDRVSIRASSSLGVSVATAQDKNGVEVNASKSSASNFELSIEGDLNESELNAINDLLGRVDKLAGQFYSGNLDDVFDKAVNLGYDDQQIASYALNLSQVQIQQVAESYSAFSPEGEQVPSLANQLAPVGDFIKDVLSTLNVAGEFANPHQLLLDLTRKMADQAALKNEEPSALSQFLERILALNVPQKTEAVSAS